MAKISLHLQYYENETAVQKNEMINIKSLGRSFNKDRKIFGVSLKTSLELRQKRLLYDFCCPRRNNKREVSYHHEWIPSQQYLSNLKLDTLFM